MSKLDPREMPAGAEAVVPPLTAAEMLQLRALLRFARYDPLQRAFVIDAGRARVTVREDGTIRCEGAEVIVTADRTITLDGAVIELN